MTDTQYSVKLFLSSGDIRRFVVHNRNLATLKSKVVDIIGSSNSSISSSNILLKYLDNEGDKVILQLDSDLAYALALVGGNLLKIYVEIVNPNVGIPYFSEPQNPYFGPENFLRQSGDKMCKKVKDFDARFISHENYPDNVEVACGTEFQKSWRIRNIGVLKWPDGCFFLQIDKANELNALSRTPVIAVNPNEETVVTVPLASPRLPGLYQTFFKMCTPEGKKFGQRMRCQILSTSDSIICPDRIDRVWEQLEIMGIVPKGERSNEISTLILKENCDISRIVRHFFK